jgi:hypothetical protein
LQRKCGVELYRFWQKVYRPAHGQVSRWQKIEKFPYFSSQQAIRHNFNASNRHFFPGQKKSIFVSQLGFRRDD